MASMRLLITLASAALLSAGCASSGASATSRTPARYVVTQADLVNVSDRSVYDALQQLRPTFLRSRDVQTTSHQEVTPVAVFVDGGRTEGLDILRTIRSSNVKELRFYEPAEANAKFGTGHNGGLIEVVMMK